MHHWTESEKAYLIRYYPTMDTNDIAKHLGIARPTVTYYARYIGLTKTIRHFKKLNHHTKRRVMPESIKEKLGFYEEYDQAISL